MWLYLARGDDIKDTDSGAYIVATSIESICASNTCISITYIMNTKIRYTNIRDAYIKVIYAKFISVRDIEPRAFARSKVILADLSTSNSLLLLSIR